MVDMKSFKKKQTFIILLAFAFILLPFSSSVTITDTTFTTNNTEFTIFVNTITLDQAVITGESITFENVTSSNTTITNTNSTVTSIVNFIGLTPGLTLFNVNTSTDIFRSTAGLQDFNITLLPFINIQINSLPQNNCSQTTRQLLNVTLLFLALAILLIPLAMLYIKGKLDITRITSSPVKMIMVFMGVVIGIALLTSVADLITVMCPN